MNQDEILEMSSFKFSSLRKYMHPIYSRLNRDLHENKERKKEILKDVVPEFYHRMRTYRGLTLDSVAKGSSISIEKLRAFEEKRIHPEVSFERAYLRACSGWQEFEYFTQMVHEFFHPTTKEKKMDVAEPAFRQFGIIIPGVDYKNLHAQRGKVLQFTK